MHSRSETAQICERESETKINTMGGFWAAVLRSRSPLAKKSEASPPSMNVSLNLIFEPPYQSRGDNRLMFPRFREYSNHAGILPCFRYIV